MIDHCAKLQLKGGYGMSLFPLTKKFIKSTLKQVDQLLIEEKKEHKRFDREFEAKSKRVNDALNSCHEPDTKR